MISMRSKITRATALLLLAAATTPVSARQLYNIPVTEAAGKQSVPVAVTAGNAGGVFLFWVDGSGVSGTLQFQILDVTGAPVLDTPQSLARDVSTASPPIVVSDGTKGAFVVWQTVRSRGNAITVQRILAAGTAAWSSPKSLGKNNRTQMNPRAVSDQKNGLYIAWEEDSALSTGSDGNRDIYAQRLNASGAKVWENTGVIISDADGNQFLGDVAGNTSALVVAWEHEPTNKVYFQGFTAGKGDPIGDNPTVPTFSPSPQIQPRLVLGVNQDGNSDNSVIIIWQEKRTAGIRLYAQKYTAARPYSWGIFGQAVSSSSGDQVAQQLVTDSDYGVIAVWEDSRNGNTDLYGQRIDRGGNTLWGASGRPVNTKGSEQTGFHLIEDGNQGVYCVWEDNRNGPFDIYAQRLNKNGRMKWQSGGIGVSKQDDHQVAPKAALLPDGRLATVWQDFRSGSADIFAQYLLDDGTLDNVPPVIISEPVRVAGSGLPYSYQVDAEDIDRDLPLTYAMEAGPDWLEMSESGLLSGTPPIGSEGSSVEVIVQAIDFRGATGSQAYELVIQTGNNPPVITSTPDTTVLEDTPYSYTVTFTDEDAGDSHSISAPVLPAWLKLDESAFVISGTPENAEVGRHDVVVRVSDQLGAFDEQKFVIEVLNTNDPPKIISVPPEKTEEDALFRFQVEAEDPDVGDVLIFSLPRAPEWLVISEASGEITGTPGNEDVGRDTVLVRVQDSAGAADSLEFVLEVINVNDPPEFISTPRRTAFPGVRYEYKVIAVDIDPQDDPIVTLDVGPVWLSYSQQDSLLAGVPPLALKGDSVIVRLLARDGDGEEAEQQFFLRISDIADTTAPRSPTVAGVEPATWTNADSLLLRWVNPADSSMIADLFLKFASPPASNTDFDVRRSLNSKPGSPDSAYVVIPDNLSGEVDGYFWLGDAAGNADFSTAVQLRFLIDRQAPQPARALRPRLWSRSDIVTFQFSPGRDSLSGVAGYRIAVVSASVGEAQYEADAVSVSDSVLQSTVSITLGSQDKNYDWFVIVVDSAGNETSGNPVSGVGIDDVRPALSHTPPDSISVGQPVVLQADVIDDGSGVDSVRVLYRSPDETAFRRAVMQQVAGSAYEVTIPSGHIRPSGFEYTIYARDFAGNEQVLRGQQSQPVYKSVPVASREVQAPQTLQQEYQLVAIPFQTKSQTVKSFFESNFGDYDNTRWRLLLYDASVQADDYIEFEQFSDRILKPGMAFWLITRKRETWKTSAVQSIPSDTPYSITVQPGWNMISSPFAFAIDTAMVQFPSVQDAVLWQYGTDLQYRIATQLEPWKGYFYFHAGTGAGQLIIDPSQRMSLPAAKTGVQTAGGWHAELSVTINGRSDQENYFGVSEDNRISEPPAIGETPRLYFIENQSGSQLARLLEPGRDTWQVRVENLSPGVLSFAVDVSGEFPEEKALLMRDQRTGAERVLVPGETWPVLIAAGESDRDFTVTVVDREGLGAPGLPSSLKLFPTQPNPFRLSRGSRITIRFALEQEMKVDLRLYNLLGQEVWRSVYAEPLPAGIHALSWNGLTRDGMRPAAGVYLLKLVAGGQVAHQKIMIVR